MQNINQSDHMTKMGAMPIYTCSKTFSQVRLIATVSCNRYYLLSCGADGAR